MDVDIVLALLAGVVIPLLVFFTCCRSNKPVRHYQPPPPAPEKPEEQIELTLEELHQFTGEEEGKPIYVAVSGRVFDVTKGADFYGPGGAYHLFAGHDCTYSFAKTSLDEADLDKQAALNGMDQMNLAGWVNTLEMKYPEIGTLLRSVDADADADVGARKADVETKHKQEANPTKSQTAEKPTSNDPPVCPMGFSRAPPMSAQEEPSREITLKELADFDGFQRSLSYIALKGYVYDMSSGLDSFGPKGAYGFMAGRDISYAVAKQSWEKSDFNRDIDDLSFAELKRLEKWVDDFDKKYTRVARLVGGATASQSVWSQPDETTRDGELSVAARDGDVERVKRLVDEGVDVNGSSARTGMSALHTAVEHGRVEVVKLLLDAGADCNTPCGLYDVANAAQLARHFGEEEIAELVESCQR